MLFVSIILFALIQQISSEEQEVLFDGLIDVGISCLDEICPSDYDYICFNQKCYKNKSSEKVDAELGSETTENNGGPKPREESTKNNSNVDEIFPIYINIGPCIGLYCPIGAKCINGVCYSVKKNYTRENELSIGDIVGPCIGGACPPGAKCINGNCYGSKSNITNLNHEPNEEISNFVKNQTVQIERMFKQLSSEIAKISQQLNRLFKVKPQKNQNQAKRTRKNNRNQMPKYDDVDDE